MDIEGTFWAEVWKLVLQSSFISEQCPWSVPRTCAAIQSSRAPGPCLLLCSELLSRQGSLAATDCPLTPFWSPRTARQSLGTLPALFLDRVSQKLISAIYADYARSLKNLGFREGALLFASKAGPAGKDLVTELEALKQEKE